MTKHTLLRCPALVTVAFYEKRYYEMVFAACKQRQLVLVSSYWECVYQMYNVPLLTSVPAFVRSVLDHGERWRYFLPSNPKPLIAR